MLNRIICYTICICMYFPCLSAYVYTSAMNGECKGEKCWKGAEMEVYDDLISIEWSTELVWNEIMYKRKWIRYFECLINVSESMWNRNVMRFYLLEAEIALFNSSPSKLRFDKSINGDESVNFVSFVDFPIICRVSAFHSVCKSIPANWMFTVEIN